MSIKETRLYTAKSSKLLDQIAKEQAGIPGYTLMQRAGKAAFQALKELWSNAEHIAVFCGGGNNGGDGLVLAKLAHEAGLDVSVYFLSDPDKLKNEALQAYKDFQKTGLELILVKNEDIDHLDFTEADVLIDALLGTGVSTTVQDPFRSMILKLNESPQPLLALDIPSGLDCKTGNQLGVTVLADVTITFIGKKQGLYTADGPDHAGDIYFADLKVPVAVYENVISQTSLLDFEDCFEQLPQRFKNSHKGDYGHVLVLGGNEGMNGAAIITANACLKSGSGLVSLATHPSHAHYANLTHPEIMSHGVTKQKDLTDLIQKATVIALGPGLGQSDWSHELFYAALHSKKPLVVDADGLNLLAKYPQKHNNWVLTPHPKEASRLLGWDVEEVQNNRFHSALELQNKFGGTIVLKGCGTLICHPDKTISVCPYGNPGMATAGMGDALTGIIASLIGQDMTFEDAANLGVCWHALTADHLAKSYGPWGYLANDVLWHLPTILPK